MKNNFFLCTCVSPQMAQVEQRLAVVAALAAPPALAPPPPPTPPARPSEESSEDSLDERKKEKKEKKKKKREKRERTEREGSQGGGGTGQPGGGGLRTRGRGKVVVDEGNGDGEEGERVEVVDPPPPSPPLPQWLFKASGPQTATARKAGAIGWSAQGLEPGCAGDQPVFSSPAHSHMTIMSIFRRLIRCLIRRKEGGRRGTWGKDASKGGFGSGNPSLVPPWLPCPRPRRWAVCPH